MTHLLKKTQKETLAGHGDASHSYSHAEKRGYADFLNQELCDDPDLPRLPIDTSNEELFEVIAEGVILGKLINHTFENTVDESKLCKKPKNKFEINENHDKCIQGARDIGCSVVNVGANDLSNGKEVPHLVMGVLWQIIKKCLMNALSNMDLGRLAEADEALDGVPPEQMLLRWFNFHLKNHGHHRIVTNFSEDISDAECYCVLLKQIAPKKVSDEWLEEGFRITDPLKRAEYVLAKAQELNCNKFVTAQDIVDGQPRLNLAFVATLFKEFPSLGPTADELAEQARRKAESLEQQLDDLQTMLDSTSLERDDLKTNLDDAMSQITSLESDLDGLRLELDDTKAGKEQAELKVGELEDMLNSMTLERDDLQGKLDTTTQEKDDLLAQLEEEMNKSAGLEEELNNTKDEFAQFKQSSADAISKLELELEEERTLKDDFCKQLEDTLLEFENFKLESEAEKNDLQSKLDTEIAEKLKLMDELSATRQELADTQKLAKEAEQTKDDLFKLLSDTMSELEDTKKNKQEAEDKLNGELDEERKSKEEFQLRLKEKTEEYEQMKADWEKERAELLARIAELEKQLEELKLEMRNRLEQAEKDKEAALRAAEEAMRAALTDAENEKDAALEKVRMLLSGSSKEGYLSVYTVSGLLGVGTGWKKRYFVLRDNTFAWYKSEKHVQTKNPVGVMYCEDSRIYEMDEKEIGKPLVFQMDNKSKRVNICCETLEEMRSWMTEIRVAKKKKLGTKVVSQQKA